MMSDAEREARSDAEATAEEDHKRVVGKVVGFKTLMAYNERGDSVDIVMSKGEPFLMVVEAGIKGDLQIWNDDWLDPYWDLRPATPRPELDGLRSFWGHGPSYNWRQGDGLSEEGYFDAGDLVLDEFGQVKIYDDVLVYEPIGEVVSA
jgi:hypothetical protein